MYLPTRNNISIINIFYYNVCIKKIIFKIQHAPEFCIRVPKLLYYTVDSIHLILLCIFL